MKLDFGPYIWEETVMGCTRRFGYFSWHLTCSGRQEMLTYAKDPVYEETWSSTMPIASVPMIMSVGWLAGFTA